MVPFNLKVLAKFDLCSKCSQKLHGCSLARARKIFATAYMLAFSLACARLLEISLILLCSYFLYMYSYINDKSVMIGLKQKGLNILTSGFSLSSTVQPVSSVLEVSARLLAITWRKTFILLIKERFRLAENLRILLAARHLLFSKVLAARHLRFS